MQRLVILFLILFPVLVSAQSAVKETPPDSILSDPVTLWATEYYVHITQSEGAIPYLSTQGDTLGYFSDTCDFCTACLEGTVFIEGETSGRVVLNYDSRADTSLINCRACPKFVASSLNVESWGSVRWKISEGFGEGVKGYKLVPYRTVAVDPNVIPYGTVLYIPDAVGVEYELGDESYSHNGFFFAGDTGGAIKGNHIDVFTGIDDSHPFNFVQSNASKTFEAFIVNDEEIETQLRNLH